MKQLFSHRLDLGGIRFKHARGVSDRSGKEFHIYHEIIYFLGGDAELISEQLHMPLQPGTLILIPRETYHQLVVHGDQEEYYRCLIQFPQLSELPACPPLHRQGILAVKGDEEIRYLFGKLTALCGRGDRDAEQLLRAVLILLLGCIPDKTRATAETDHQSRIILSAIRYIDLHLGERLPVATVAAACSVSPSSLAHTFKQEMNISVHQFILRKRLIAAYHRIAAGLPATAAAEECGFHDYSGFYRQYRNMFGFPPSHSGQNPPVIRE